MSSFLGLSAAQSRQAGNRASSPDRNVDVAADILAELRVLEREEEDDSYSLLDGSSVGNSAHRDIPVRSARDMQPRSAAAGSGGHGGESSFITPLRHGSSRVQGKVKALVWVKDLVKVQALGAGPPPLVQVLVVWVEQGQALRMLEVHPSS